MKEALWGPDHCLNGDISFIKRQKRAIILDWEGWLVMNFVFTTIYHHIKLSGSLFVYQYMFFFLVYHKYLVEILGTELGRGRRNFLWSKQNKDLHKYYCNVNWLYYLSVVWNKYFLCHKLPFLCFINKY